MDSAPQATAPPSTGHRPKRRFGRWLLIAVALLALALVAGYAFIASEAGLRFAVGMVIARSDGRLDVESPAGSILSAVRVKRLVWRGPAATLTADDISIDWNPFALWSRGIVVKGLGAQRITLAIEASDTAVPLPASLALPTNVAIDEIGVANFEWQVGKNSGSIRGLTFGYSGGAAMHRVERLSLVADRGTLTGNLSADARPPFAINGALTFDGDPQLKAVRADMSVSGTIDAIAINADGRTGAARFTLSARLTPFAAVALDTLSLDARELDLAEWDATLPATRLSVKAEARPVAGGLAGRFDATNALAGPIDAERLPVRSLSASFAWRADALELDEVVAELAGGGRASGRVNVPLNGDAGKWTLDVRDIDLQQVYTPMARTRLSGTLGADLAAASQRIDGNVADRTIVGGIGVSFAATLADRNLVVESFRIRAGTGELAGRGRFEFTGRRAFDVTARATRIDPSRFGKFPSGALDGEVAASGELEPAWRVGVKAAIVAGSRLADAPVSGTARATVGAHAIRDAAIDLRFAHAKLTANGSAGEGADGLTVTLDAPQIAEFAALLPGRLPHPLSGKMNANAVMRGDIAHGGLELQAHGEALKAGPALTIAAFDARVSVAAAAVGASADPNDRPLKVDVAATGVVAPQGTFSRAEASVDGTLARHTTSMKVVGEDLDVEVSAHGGIRESSNAAGVGGWTWTGTVDTLENRGAWTLRLAAPASFEVARGHVQLGAARIAVADGYVEIAALVWDDGHVTTRGTFAAVPIATAARLAGIKLPFVSTLTIKGDWSLAAAPRLNGMVNVRREAGDIFLSPETVVDPSNRALGITAVDLSARFRDDAVDATAALRSGRGLNADAQLAIGVVPDAPPGHLAADAPVRLALTADLATLKVLQPWVGITAVVDGNAHAELVASGTLARAPLSGTIRAAGLRIEAPQYGVFFTDGRLNARLADGILTLDEFSLVGGAGRFTASGTLATGGEMRGDGAGAAANMTWNAEEFRLFNRPDLRLIVGGAGTLALKDRRILLEGALRAEEGHVEYAADGGVTLGDDVVVKGWPANDRDGSGRDRLPLRVDLELDLGQKLTFTGEGLETALRGKVRVTTAADGSVRGRGTIEAFNGTYTAFGQRLVIDRGRLIFDGPLDNPGLDIVALRKNLAVEAGVSVSGTVKVPIIQLTSVPPVPDNEKLSWLVLGQAPGRASGSDMAALQAASAALLGRNTRSITSTIAQSVGLDDISVGTGATSTRNVTGGGSPASGQVVAFGKRITDKLSLVYEQGLTVATNALRLEYSLTHTLTLRAEAGAISSFGIYYRRVFD